MEPLSERETHVIQTMYALHMKGITLVAVELPEYSKKLFPNGFSIDKYNEIVPKLVKLELLELIYDSPRDGPVLQLTDKALESFANG